jgi:hypothetical protein
MEQGSPTETIRSLNGTWWWARGVAMFEEYDCMKGTGARVVVGQGVVDDPMM